MGRIERSVALAPEPRSASLARRELREALRECGRLHLQDAAELALTELVTNAVLHAHTQLTVRLACSDEELRVEVDDDSPVLIPVSPVTGDIGTTGRGLALVAAISREHGVTARAHGKTVWFTLGDTEEPERSADELLEAWSDEEMLVDAAVRAAGRRVPLQHFPPTLWLAAAAQHDSQLRELALVRSASGRPTDDLAAADRARFAVRAALEIALSSARAAGLSHNPLPQDHPGDLEEVPVVLDLDLDLSVEGSPASDFAALQDVLDEAQRLSHAGRMLAAPALPEIVAVRDWVADQVVSILAGQTGRPWPGLDAEEALLAVDHSARQLDFDTAIHTSAQSVIVVDRFNRIVGINADLADSLLWSAEQLVGRRVAVLIPARYRESHTAGFTRHLTTGQAQALGVELQLPVLTRDGHERTFTFLIREDRTRSGQPVYLACLTPAAEAPQPNS